MLEIEYDPLLVGISIAVALMGSWTALALAHSACHQIQKTPIQAAVSYINSAVVMGGSVWAMHFIAMLSLGFPVAVTYSFTETVASLVLAIAVSGLGLFVASQRSALAVFIGGALIGLGVVGMHYLGVSAIRGCGVSFDTHYAIISALMAIVAATAGLWFAFRKHGIPQIVLGGLIIGASVAWVHYTGMYATSFFLDPSLVAVSRPHLPQSVLAYAIAMAAIAVCSAQLLMITGSATKLGRSPGIS